MAAEATTPALLATTGCAAGSAAIAELADETAFEAVFVAVLAAEFALLVAEISLVSLDCAETLTELTVVVFVVFIDVS
ncbi:hypothetical protein ACUIJP_07370 [Leuconostoc pseudomesenteroides]|uniref:hypothetical protein n=1 Tax=Leuconostoc pseudomesenteroides TaxID=33968 RepID=UPI00403D9529